MKVLEFWTPSCGPCRIAKAAIASLRAEGYPIVIEEINAHENVDMAVLYGVRAVPTWIIVDDSGQPLSRTDGAMNTNQLKTFIDQATTLKF